MRRGPAGQFGRREKFAGGINILINRKVDYALRSLIFLAEKRDAEWSSTLELSKKLRLPRVFLAKIVNALARKKIVETQRGKAGGLRLLKKDATVAEVIKLLDPKFSLNKCLGESYSCFLEKSCSLHKLLKLIEKELFDKLSSVTIMELA
ncbi:hypothetical protein A2625_06905 [candidate division WOR-1 bacterium RIFCSPHIGHO2_01_FULL_53_15]|uniref:Rrf2 family transcriptional regulator n=1 Tax=candidate division WOR-1 bacterium RIFCSPHIGHO2_01_FULL_53_15 TaxID=1802564 RepID=A0A1F4Q589_UNCSA|nr:MAG: hypothetical protein A2625_06905 [candidate division WOR-1 bacterium RIFCSPHIGHO2_01_FULL_53_15]OGC10330.1 MAG: hypothetical protein A3D23_06910 [candidate division WOR-1 bacterium RIFCSPHIGHO2_02_FULL_53_26]